MKRSVIFDLDGTLCDTSGDLLAAANAAFDALGVPARLDAGATEDRATALRGGRAMLRLGLSRLGDVDEALVDRGYQPLLDAYADAICEHTTFYPGALEAVERLRVRGDVVAICTNKPEGLARSLMAELGASTLFDALLGADTLAVRKPDPLHFTETVVRAGGNIARSCLIGDTATDRNTAAAAGVPCVLVTFAPGGPDVASLEPEALLGHFDDLDAVLDGLGV